MRFVRVVEYVVTALMLLREVKSEGLSMSATAASWPMMTGALLRFNDVTIGRGGAPEAVAPIATPLRSASLQCGVTLLCTK